MSMSTNVQAFISDKDETYKKHKKVLLACVEAEIKELPKETAKYFGSKYPEKYLLEEKLTIQIPVHKYEDNEMASQGYEIFVSEIPKGTCKIRFSNSW